MTKDGYGNVVSDNNSFGWNSLNNGLPKKPVSPVAPSPSYKEILPPSFNYTPSQQWIAQMAQMNQQPQFNGLLSGQQPFNLQPQRTAPQGGTYRAPAQNSAALVAQYLK